MTRIVVLISQISRGKIKQDLGPPRVK